jgi:hypothetical protein
MRKLEHLIEALEQDGHPDIRTKINTQHEKTNKTSHLKRILTPEEINKVSKTLEAYKPPSPTGWANALYIHNIKKTVKDFTPDNTPDYDELGNLINALYAAGLKDPEILCKLTRARDSMKRYQNGAIPP